MDKWREQPTAMDLLRSIEEDRKVVRLLFLDLHNPHSRTKIQQALNDIEDAAHMLKCELGLEL